MLQDSTAMACFSTDSVERSKDFYHGTLGIPVAMSDAGSLVLQFAGGTHALVYLREDHVPAAHTVLVLGVKDIAAEVADLKSRGVAFADLPYTDDDGIARQDDMPLTAWFQDPSGNWIAVSEGELA